MGLILAYVLIMCGAFLELSIAEGGNGTSSDAEFDVTKFGAVGDGKTDDSKAFEEAWTAACGKSLGSVSVIVPSGRTFLVSPIKFAGPCKSSSIIFEILGKIVAQPRQAWKNRSGDQWLYFYEVDGLSILGNRQGVIDGHGDSWWSNGDPNNSPTALRISHCNKLHVSGLKHKNSQRNHISINDCNNANISHLHILAPATSPNTDGIDISSSTNLHIQDSVMETGDDCIAINGGTSNVFISRITCGPGHGISVGSLGKNGRRDEVEGIHVNNCTFIRTENGVRIKTWQGGSGFARNINFKDIKFIEADNPVLIDQYYCPHKQCDTKESAVEISGVKYIGLRGTSIRKKALINLSCSQTVPCSDIILQNVDVRPADSQSSSSANCINARGTSRICNPPVNCLENNS